MNNIPRQMLCRITAKYGTDICGDARRCEGLLNDLCGAYRREINVLVNAVEERVPLDLLAGRASVPTELLLTRLEKRLEEQTALTDEAARWAVESWALALNVATNDEIEAREKRTEPAAPLPDTKKIQPSNTNNQNNPTGSSKTPPVNRGSAAAPPKMPPIVAPTRNNSPVARPPAPMPKPAPPVNFPRSNQPVNQPPVQRLPVNQPAAPRRGFGLFRGCLLVLFLLAVASFALFFGVPYAIDVMRQTQQERSNEPPRFPVR